MKRHILVWREEPEPPPPPYAGSYVVIEPEGPFYSVSIEPPTPCGAGAPLTFGSKNEAWGTMLAWARQFGLPVRDLTDGRVGPRDG